MSLAIIIPTYGTEKKVGKTHINWLGVSCHTDSSWLHELHGSISTVYETFLYREREYVYYHQNVNFQENHLQLEPMTSRTPTATDAVNTFNALAHSRRGSDALAQLAVHAVRGRSRANQHAL
jgi:hypothetical protein